MGPDVLRALFFGMIDSLERMRRCDLARRLSTSMRVALRSAPSLAASLPACAARPRRCRARRVAVADSGTRIRAGGGRAHSSSMRGHASLPRARRGGNRGPAIRRPTCSVRAASAAAAHAGTWRQHAMPTPCSSASIHAARPRRRRSLSRSTSRHGASPVSAARRARPVLRRGHAVATDDAGRRRGRDPRSRRCTSTTPRVSPGAG